MIKDILYKITASLLIVLLFGHNINTLVTIGDFMINQDYISKNLCVQKENQKGCNGTCVLNKEISNALSDSTSKSPIPETERFSLDSYCLYSIKLIDASIHKTQLIKHNQVYTQPIFYQNWEDIETPPPNFS